MQNTSLSVRHIIYIIPLKSKKVNTIFFENFAPYIYLSEIYLKFQKKYAIINILSVQKFRKINRVERLFIMKLTRFRPENKYRKLCMGVLAEIDLTSKDNVFFGMLEENGDAELLYTDYLDSIKSADIIIPSEEFRTEPPSIPDKIIEIKLNSFKRIENSNIYSKHTEKFSNEIRITGHNSAIIKPKNTSKTLCAGGLAFIIAKETCKGMSPEQISKYIFGYTGLNVITFNDNQEIPKIYSMGPCVNTSMDFEELTIQTKVNGEIIQNISISKNYILTTVAEFISKISEHTMLKKGDILAIGMQAKDPPLNRGDIMETEVKNIGILRNILMDS